MIKKDSMIIFSTKVTSPRIHYKGDALT